MSRLLLALLCVLAATSGTECESESAWQSALENAHSYLESLMGKDALGTSSKVMNDFIKVTSEATASALNAAAVYLTALLTASGFDFDLSARRVTPEGVVFVAQWTVLVALAYWLFSLALGLLAGVWRSAMTLIKLGLATCAFVGILSDAGASVGTTGARLAALVFVCVLLGVGPVPAARDPGSRLERRVERLERRLAEVEEKRAERRRERQ